MGPFEAPRSPLHRVERPATSTRDGPVPTTTSEQTATTTTLTSMVATFAAVPGPAYAPDAGGLPHQGLTSVHPM